MKIAVTYENGQVYPHFGHTEQFLLLDTREQPDGNRPHRGRGAWRAGRLFGRCTA